MATTAGVALLALLAACAGAGSPRGPDRDYESIRGVYAFRGLISNQTVNGLVELGDAVVVTSNLGQCRTPIAAVRIMRAQGGGMRRLGISCDLNLTLRWNLDGTVVSPAQASIPNSEERVTRGPCVRWGSAQPGQQPPCLDYERKVETITRWLSGELQVTKQ
ncbi:MAG: hypothetical protein FIB01_12385 [Gemmatimonadetes bacterium]|nr:hypothetical protein [Gemmatimonadota bacterium]